MVELKGRQAAVSHMPDVTGRGTRCRFASLEVCNLKVPS